MTPEMWFVAALLGVAVVFFVTEWLRVDVVALGVIVALMLSGVLTTSEALAGFSHSVVLTILALFIVGGAVLQTGLAALIGEGILKFAGTNELRLMIVIMVAVALLSGFMSDTGTVAVLLPAVIALARTAKLSPAKLLIPLSFGALLGGAMTMIGTPPNIYVSNVLREAGYEPFQFFSFTPVGLLLLAAGVLYMVLVGRHQLPAQPATEAESLYGDQPDELLELYLDNELAVRRVSSTSPLHGKTVAESSLKRDFDVTVVEIMRPEPDQELVSIGNQRIVRQSDNFQMILPQGETKIYHNDFLALQGKPDSLEKVATEWTLRNDDRSGRVREMVINDKIGIAEVILRPRSHLVGQTIKEIRFGSRYKLKVLNILRPSQQRISGEAIGDLQLEFGDTLLVEGYWENILALRDKPHEFILMGQPEVAARRGNRRYAPIAFVIMITMLVALIFGEDLLVRMTGNQSLSNILNVASISLTAALLMVLAGCLTMDDAFRSIDWKCIILIAGMIPMSTALQKVGLADLIATNVTQSLGPLGPYAIMAGLFLLTSGFTQVISNSATTVILAPIALTIASQYGIAPHAFLMAVAIAASMAFASPVASPVNMLVMGAGNYTFRDYLKIGVPLIFLMLLVTLVFVPLVFPF